MWQIVRVALIPALVVMFTGCGGDDGGTGPGGGTEETLLSGANQDTWTFEDGCFGGPLWEDGAFRILATPLAPPTCDGNPGGLWVKNAGPIDVRQYSNVRARFTVKLELNSPASGDGQAYASVMVSAAESDISVSTYSGYWALRDLGSQSFEEDFDILLDSEEWEHLLHVYLDVRLHCYVLTADGVCTDRAVAEIRDFRIVAER